MIQRGEKYGTKLNFNNHESQLVMEANFENKGLQYHSFYKLLSIIEKDLTHNAIMSRLRTGYPAISPKEKLAVINNYISLLLIIIFLWVWGVGGII